MGRARCQLDACGWQVGWIRRRCVETGPALRFCGGLGVDKPRSLGGHSVTTICVDGVSCSDVHAPFCLGRVLPGCFQISRANPKRLQLLKRGSVLETHWHHLFGSGVRQKGQFWRTGKAGLFTCSRARGLHKLASYACLDSLLSPPIFPFATYCNW